MVFAEHVAPRQNSQLQEKPIFGIAPGSNGRAAAIPTVLADGHQGRRKFS
jgi:hypothetical protein